VSGIVELEPEALGRPTRRGAQRYPQGVGHTNLSWRKSRAIESFGPRAASAGRSRKFAAANRHPLAQDTRPPRERLMLKTMLKLYDGLTKLLERPRARAVLIRGDALRWDEDGNVSC
jgi:hypothetical protein